MKNDDLFISKIDILILKELLEIKASNFTLNTTSLCNQVQRQHKILKPHIDHLLELGLIELKPQKNEKILKINPTKKNFCNQLVLLWEDKYSNYI